MKNVLWIQTEPKDSLWLNGESCSKDYINYTLIVSDVNYYEVTSKNFAIYHNKYKHEVVVNGHLNELDSANRRIPFSFYITSDNIFKIMDVLKSLVEQKGFSLSESECKSLLGNYVNQRFIPFLKKDFFLSNQSSSK